MRTDPVGVKLLSGSGFSSLSDVRSVETTTICQIIAISRYGRENGIVKTSAEGQKCLPGAACLGLAKSPDRFIRGDLNRALTKNAAAAKGLQDKVFAIGNDSRIYKGLLTAPVDLFPGKPDVVVLYLTPGQALKALLGLSFEKGEVVENPITGQSSVCQSIARAMTTGRMILEIPCIGDRTYGLVQDNELVIVVPASKVEQMLEGMKGTDGFAQYPFTPFLTWPAILPAEFEPTRSELYRE